MQSPPNPQDPRKPDPPIRELVGATSAPIRLGKNITQTTFNIHPPAGPALLHNDLMTRRVFLKIENITASRRAPAFDVYVNLPAGVDREKVRDWFVGNLSLFGLVESSRQTDQHPGNGLSYTREITELYRRLITKGDWDQKTLRVTFVPGEWWGDIDVKVGRISLIFE